MSGASAGDGRVGAAIPLQGALWPAVLDFAAETLFVGFFYLFVGGLGVLVGWPQASLVLPPVAIAVAAPLVFGFRVWPGVFLGAWFLGLTAVHDPRMAGEVAAGNTLEGLAAAWLVKRCTGEARKRALEELTDPDPQRASHRLGTAAARAG